MGTPYEGVILEHFTKKATAMVTVRPDTFLREWATEPKGDQPRAISELLTGLDAGLSDQVLMGVTGSGKTFTMANVIQQSNRPSLVLAHNKTLAAQLFQEFKALFPKNAIEYFISYYDYYQPEAYIPGTDTYIEKTSKINEDIDKMRHSATRTLFERHDAIVVSSVSCIYGLGNPKTYLENMVLIEKGQSVARDAMLKQLIHIQYSRNDHSLERGKFRVRGDIVEIVPSHEKDHAIRVQFWGDEVEDLSLIDALTGEVKEKITRIAVYPSSHFVTDKERLDDICASIYTELKARLKEFRAKQMHVEAQRIEQRTLHDLEMIRELGYCPGIENYSRFLDGRTQGEPPATLIDYFPKDFILFVDESHVTIPQIGGMYRGDRARKQTLVDYGWRLPAALDNRPLNFNEFQERIGQVIYVSATPGPYELEKTNHTTVEQVIRPTGLVDPPIEVRPATHQVDDLVGEINKTIQEKGRVLITTLTKKMAEELTAYFEDLELKVRYLHSDIDTIERVEILRELRRGDIDIVVGINLLREGLDLPEVRLVAVLDADKEGFLRSRSSLIQTVGRAARNSEGRVIMYADSVTKSMRACIDETQRRRQIQIAHNRKHNITPLTIKKEVPKALKETHHLDFASPPDEEVAQLLTPAEKELLRHPRKFHAYIEKLTKRMHQAANSLDFEKAAELRDKIAQLSHSQLQLSQEQNQASPL